MLRDIVAPHLGPMHSCSSLVARQDKKIFLGSFCAEHPRNGLGRAVGQHSISACCATSLRRILGQCTPAAPWSRDKTKKFSWSFCAEHPRNGLGRAVGQHSISACCATSLRRILGQCTPAAPWSRDKTKKFSWSFCAEHPRNGLGRAVGQHSISACCATSLRRILGQCTPAAPWSRDKTKKFSWGVFVLSIRGTDWVEQLDSTASAHAARHRCAASWANALLQLLGRATRQKNFPGVFVLSIRGTDWVEQLDSTASAHAARHRCAASWANALLQLLGRATRQKNFPGVFVLSIRGTDWVEQLDSTASAHAARHRCAASWANALLQLLGRATRQKNFPGVFVLSIRGTDWVNHLEGGKIIIPSSFYLLFG
jgi:hypothetical protein